MAVPILVPDNQTVFRGMRNSNWCKRGVVNYRAFMLRPATEDFPIEQELSLGLTPESAVDELRENYGVAALIVLRIHNLPHNLTVRPSPNDEAKVDIHGLPLHSNDPADIDRAVTVATDLADIVDAFIPPNPGRA